MAGHKKKRERRTYTAEFKQQLIGLYKRGKRRVDICRKYDIIEPISKIFIIVLIRSSIAYSAVENSKNKLIK